MSGRSRWILRSLVPGLILSSAMLATVGCSDEGPGVSGDASKGGAPAQVVAGKGATDAPAKKGGRNTGADRAKTNAPAGAQ
jgi:hypothetical protein